MLERKGKQNIENDQDDIHVKVEMPLKTNSEQEEKLKQCISIDREDLTDP